ncbi:GNAT family N-acetyltransferase [Thalassomonas actiniarum]|uniref:GNAT family N-acetyltransferase n=1 Tax=Thalassomonas actiniarum TaxID=485447 RepID=UPI001F409C31|nr:GNAT family N-acetyltransferase [Thalassomonas actiniarum]
MNKFELQTPRLKIREISSQDLDNLPRVLADPQVMLYSTVGVHNREQIQAYIENCQQQYLIPGYGTRAIVDKVTNEFIGICGLHKENLDDRALTHLNYRLAVKHQGKGYASEAVNGLLTMAKDTLNLDCVSALIEPENRASVNVVTRQGFDYRNTTSFRGFKVDVYQIKI